MRATFTGQAVRLAVVLALVGSPGSATWAQGPAAESGAGPAAKNVSAVTPTKGSRAAGKPQGGPQEGIRLRGMWTIEIRNPDGTLVKRRVFHNNLLPSGKIALAKLLSGPEPITNWFIVANESQVTSPTDISSPLCQHTIGSNEECRVFPKNIPPGSTDDIQGFATLTWAVNGDRLVLEGFFKATHPNASQVQRFVAHVFRGGVPEFLTLAVLPTPEPIRPDQLVQFTYTISFQ